MKGYKDLITEARELATENISQPTVFYKDKSQRIMLRLCDALEKALTELDRLAEAQRRERAAVEYCKSPHYGYGDYYCGIDIACQEVLDILRGPVAGEESR